jgi:hypothetical protein
VGKGKIKPSALGNGGKIPIPKQTAQRTPVSFSFKYLVLAHEKFTFTGRDYNYLHAVFERMRLICGMTVDDMRIRNARSLRCHQIKWDDTSEPDGFAHLPEQLQDTCPFQFQFSSNEHGRAHGFFIDSVFFVVWLDPDHKLYQ